jgi:MFS family permease
MAETSEPFAEAARGELSRLGQLLVTPAFLGMVLPLMALKINFATLQAGLPIFGEQRLGAGLVQVSYLFVVTALAYGVVQPLAGRAADRWSTRRLLSLTLVSMAPVLALMAIQHTYWVFLPVYAGFSVLQSAGVLFAMKHLGAGIGEGANGRSFGLASAIGDMGMIVAPSLLLPLYSWHAEALFGALGLLALIFLGGFWALSGPSLAPEPQREAL